MKAVKSTGFGRVFGLRRKGPSEPQNVLPPLEIPEPIGSYPPGSVEALAINALVSSPSIFAPALDSQNPHTPKSSFCTNDATQADPDNDPAVFLPTIVESCESSPSASAEIAHLIGEFFGKPFQSHEQIQYKAVMVMRILIDNQGVTTFARNLDKSFATNAKMMLRSTKNQNARMLLIETMEKLDSLYPREGTQMPVAVSMWRREKEKYGHSAQYAYALYPQYYTQGAATAPHSAGNFLHGQGPVMQPSAPRRHDYFSREHSARHLPSPAELASRLEEARTSAKLLQQCVANSSPSDLLTDDLVKEFVSRCQSAAKSVQVYMAAENPAPDNATMESLIETNEQLQSALSTHQRAVLNARKSLGIDSNTKAPVPAAAPVSAATAGLVSPMSDVAPQSYTMGRLDTTVSQESAGQARGMGRPAEPVSAVSSEGDNPFRDPAPGQAAKGKGRATGYGVDDEEDLYDITPQRTRENAQR
ncbi:hypothetical protein TD95_003835 [Thielaviopsis punctulata]|uniref:GAT domain-containing protein n=1 Tax=Thielaviopsis punctulata TaxID=72032 RepID=A0A0F4Z7P9_9PEZI|nr:hypothetical protein TD95_003835 [Thielaviopsis punctulata]